MKRKTASAHDSEDVSRAFFALPDPLPFPTGTTFVERVGDGDPKPDDPWVYLRFHQVHVSVGREDVYDEAVLHVTRGLDDVPTQERPVSEQLTLGTDVTVVEAITPFASPDEPPADWSGQARDLPPRSDALNRCFRLVQEYGRAYRVAAGVPYGLVTYERLSPSVIVYSGSVPLRSEGESTEVRLVAAKWDGPLLVVLEHTNLGDPVVGPEISGAFEPRFVEWMQELRFGSFFSWREHLLAAQRAAEVEGDFRVAVVLAQTATEVLLDRILGLLMWEEGADARDVRDVFQEGKVLRRITKDIPQRLGGNWSTRGVGAVASWYEGSMRLRHRVVHGGYEPTRLEAETAISSVLDLQTFIFDRVAERRNRYPRAALMTLGKEGLKRRRLWRGHIRHFSETVADTEPNWRVAFRAWLKDMGEEAEPGNS